VAAVFEVREKVERNFRERKWGFLMQRRKIGIDYMIVYGEHM
jgi:hypothetical protein